MLQGLQEREDPKTNVRTAAQMSVFKYSDTVERVRGLHGLNLQNKWSHSNGVTRKVVMAGYPGFATYCALVSLFVEEICSVVSERCKEWQLMTLSYLRKLQRSVQVWNETRYWYFETSKSIRLRRFELQDCRFSHQEVKDQVLVVKRKLKCG
ncbi:hypothetical protein Bca4012_009881 [Brassica carinata]|uniref:Uncharacterized protein n=1 Tax=Brassica carinata TaxID=52824 RepID=A0A8X7V081_BRACI|nr:hypothetical protein Bca52824_035107 [Brassica carinata]